MMQLICSTGPYRKHQHHNTQPLYHQLIVHLLYVYINDMTVCIDLLAILLPLFLLISNMATIAPSFANLSTVALPIPEAPPINSI